MIIFITGTLPKAEMKIFISSTNKLMSWTYYVGNRNNIKKVDQGKKSFPYFSSDGDAI